MSGVLLKGVLTKTQQHNNNKWATFPWITSTDHYLKMDKTRHTIKRTKKAIPVQFDLRETIGVFPKWNRNLLNSVNTGILKITEAWNVLNLNILSLHVSCWCCGSTLLSSTVGGWVVSSSPFTVMTNIFVTKFTEFSLNSVKTFRKKLNWCRQKNKHLNNWNFYERIRKVKFSGSNVVPIKYIGGCKGYQWPTPPGVKTFIFMQFLAKNRLTHPLWELAPPSQKSPGCATEMDTWDLSSVQTVSLEGHPICASM